MTSRLYFAYGSNLHQGAFAAYCRKHSFSPDSLRFDSKAFLQDEELAFDRFSSTHDGGVLNLRSRSGSWVDGALFEPTEEGWRVLDRKEGHPRHYRREIVRVLREDGAEIDAVTYRAPATADFVEPTEDYLDLCCSGREILGLNARAVNAAARRTRPGAVFAYGRLMRGEALWNEIASFGINCCILAKAPGFLVDHGSYPGLVPLETQEGEFVEGEFIAVDDIDGALAVLDRIEGFYGEGNPRNRFRRIETDVDPGHGNARACYAYSSLKPDLPRISGGDWRAHRGKRRELLSSLLDAHMHLQPDLIERLAWVPASPFSTIWKEDRSAGKLLDALEIGEVREIHLCQASDRWAVLDLQEEPKAASPAPVPGPTTRGPAPTSWSGHQVRDASGPALTYVLRYGARNVWKIGWCKDLVGRLREVNSHVPHEVIGERWIVAMHEVRSTSLAAYELEQALLGLLDAHRTVGERVVCPDRIVRDAWAVGARRDQLGTLAARS